MKRFEFEPFGERLAPEGAKPNGVSRGVLWTGTALFWSLVALVVVARAVYFDPSEFAALARAVF